MSDDIGLKYPLIRRTITETPWAILPSKLDEIVDFIAFKAAGGEISAEDLASRFGAQDQERSRQKSTRSVAVMPVMGTISHRMNMLAQASGGESIESLTNTFRSLVNNDRIDAIVLDVDSPGGSVSGVEELATEIYEARGTKPITAVANSLMASAAYWIASSADEIVASPSGKLGSIGVLAAHEDRSKMYEKMGVDVSLVSAGKYKAENNPFEPLSDEGRAEIQKRVDESYDMFVSAVARNRGVLVDTVRNGFGEGRVVGAKEAVALGMADSIATLDDVVNRIASEPESGDAGVNAEWVSAPYTDCAARVTAGATVLTQRTRERIEFRRGNGRDLSYADRDQLAETRNALSKAVTELDALLIEDKPAQNRNAAQITRMRRMLRDADARLIGIND